MGLLDQAGATSMAPQAPTQAPHVSSEAILAQPEQPMHQSAKAEADALMAGEEEEPNVTDEEQAEYERIAEAIGDMLYRNKAVSEAIEQMITPKDKIGSLMQASLLIYKDLDNRLDIDQIVTAEVTRGLVAEMIEFAEAMGIQYTGRENQQILAGVWEGVMALTAGDSETINEDYATVTEGMGEEEIQEAMASYQQLVNEGQGMGET